MELKITGRHLDVTEALKDYLDEKISRLEKYARDIIDTHVILQMEKRNAVVEVNMKLKRFNVNVKESNLDMYAAIDKSFEALRKQIVRHEDKLKAHRYKHRKEEDGVIR